MNNKKWFYEKNDYLLNSHVNRNFEDILVMDEQQFRQWCKDVRSEVTYAWDVLGIPPRVGYNKDQIIDQFSQMETFNTKKFEIVDEFTGEKDVIRNTHILGNAINQWFETMMKVRINYTEKDNGRSIYDFFACDDLLDRFIKFSQRHFKRDSFYAYSRAIEIGDTSYGHDLPFEDNGLKWLISFNESYKDKKKYSFWLAPIKEEAEYTGYNNVLKGKKYLTVSKKELWEFWKEWYGCDFDNYPPPHSIHTSNCKWKEDDVYQIRVFEPGQKLFPTGLKAWKVSFNQYAVNYPPLIAKYIYEKFTEDFKTEDNIYVWDPSSGWGGRLLGALTVKSDRHITYLGNDPNTDHNTYDGRTKYHEIYDFYCENVDRGGLWDIPHNDFQFWQLGSEIMQYDNEFQKYKGKISLVFTSPPYFNREGYSEDDTQSYKKFTSYELWKDGFLYETLKTAYEWLRPGGYMVWNIADLKVGNKYLPLEQDSKDIMTELGFKYVHTYKMALNSMPGANRMNADGTATVKNSCKVAGQTLKYEPVIVFKK